MIRLQGGPCDGSYAAARAPVFLRAVFDIRTGATDVLDMPNDTPARDELVYVYRRTGDKGSVAIMRGRRCEWYSVADYVHLPEVPGATLTDTEAWRAWCMAHKDDFKE